MSTNARQPAALRLSTHCAPTSASAARPRLSLPARAAHAASAGDARRHTLGALACGTGTAGAPAGGSPSDSDSSRVSGLCHSGAPAAPRRALTTPDGRLVLSRLLQAGSGGRVYLAHTNDAARRVCVVKTAPARAGLELHKEAYLLTTHLGAHPAVLAPAPGMAVSTCPRTGRVYLPLEHVSGGDLLQRLERQGPLAPTAAAAIVGRVAAAVAHCHAYGVFHRDVTLANVLLAPAAGAGSGSGEPPQPKLADFGSATTCPAPAHCATTRSYAAPEALACPTAPEGDGSAAAAAGAGVPYDAAAADAWSLGVVLFASLHKCFPWDAANGVDKLFQHYATTGTFHPRATSYRGACAGSGADAGSPGGEEGVYAAVMKLTKALLSLNPAARPTAATAAAVLGALATVPGTDLADGYADVDMEVDVDTSDADFEMFPDAAAIATSAVVAGARSRRSSAARSSRSRLSRSTCRSRLRASASRRSRASRGRVSYPSRSSRAG